MVIPLRLNRMLRAQVFDGYLQNLDLLDNYNTNRFYHKKIKTLVINF